MTVLNFSYATIKDAGKFREYVVAAKVLLDEAGVDVVVRGDFFDVMRGDNMNPHVVAVFRYHDKEAAKRFYASPSYLKLVPLRDAACDMQIVLYDEMV
ncbi:DUF1330 domain-containing protein [Enterovibrio sp. ZSDZ35]|uniref:DUF1330 domain-containing protein n=1 Tax=Enterovibrio qingdaonensis TaxID=2899818 RepID=A0ABT5QMC9_9GAMM|nr:DUF1330 domain-containing protein [Enterovibrio sp. ZSDZ35]MDD1782147.1 DUF1330 domain-containing protein [Enterovibrio sp. ZSDZ35]